MSTVHDLRLAPVAAGAWAAALVATTGAVTLALVVGLALMATAVAVLVSGRAHRCPGLWWQSVAAVGALTGVAVAIVALVAGARLDTHGVQGAALVEAGDTQAWVSIDGHAAPMRALDNSERFRTAGTVTAWRPHCDDSQECEPWEAASIPVVVVLDERPSRGANVRVDARWSASERAPAVAVAWQAHMVESASPGLLWSLREKFAQATASLDPDVRGLVRGMAVGDTSAMPDGQVRDMRVSGLAHLTAVSGAHFAVLVMACIAVFGAVRAPRVVRAFAVLVVAATFAAIVGPDASVVRALAMAVAVALALAWGRPARGAAALFVGVTVLLIMDPWLSRALGFAMSVLAVMAIVMWSPRVATILARVMTPGFARLVAIPIVAQAVVTPLLVVIEPAVGPYAVVANLLAGLAVLPTMLACVATLAVASIHVPLAQVFADLAAQCASVIAFVARTTAQAPGAWLPWPPGTTGVVLSASATVLMVIVTLHIRVSYRLAAAVWVMGLMGVGLSLASPDATPVPADWEVAACDIGQGDMLLLRAGEHAAVVVDTGPPNSGAAECLRRHRIGHVPLIILTHPHQDHDGAVSDVLDSAHVDQAWVAAAGFEQPALAVQSLASADVPVTVPQAGELFVAGDVVVEAVSEWHEDTDIGENDASLVVRARAGHTTAIALGDLEVAGQRALLGRLDTGLVDYSGVDVVKMAHHGSAQQLPALIERLQAHVTLVSVGEDNRHGHPTASALDLYGEHSQAVLRTDICGDVHVSRASGTLRWSQC